MSDWTPHIQFDPAIRGGKPCVRGTRITVEDVLGFLATREGVEEVIEDFPSLTRETIRACCSFAADRERESYARREFAPRREPVVSAPADVGAAVR